jgi:hypothetical protein
MVFLFNIENLVLRASQSSIALLVKIARCFGILEFMKSQAPSTKSQGFRCQVSGKKNTKAET